MNEEYFNTAKDYFNNLEKQISLLPIEQQGLVFRRCAENCVKSYVFPLLKQRYEKCGGNLDLFFSEAENTDYSFQKVIEKGRVYEMGYPRCLCFMHENGFAKEKIHCECSRQSILFVMKELFPDIVFSVVILETVLGGADKCTFRVSVNKT